MKRLALIGLSLATNVVWLGLTVLYFLPHMIDWTPFRTFVAIVGITAMIVFLALGTAWFIVYYVFRNELR